MSVRHRLSVPKRPSRLRSWGGVSSEGCSHSESAATRIPALPSHHEGMRSEPPLNRPSTRSSLADLRWLMFAAILHHRIRIYNILYEICKYCAASYQPQGGHRRLLQSGFGGLLPRTYRKVSHRIRRLLALRGKIPLLDRERYLPSID